jgi:cellulose synthase/poly-beta-1,6-N-acetylglucosamine synthase-like glycosyltransferase
MTQLFAETHTDFLVGAFLAGFALCGIIYAYVGYPLLLWALSRWRPRYHSVPSTEPALTIIIAAHNEAAGMKKKLEQTLMLEYPRDRIQIIVASDGSDDGTDEIVHEFASSGVELVAIKDRMGKTNAQNIAARHARNPILVFSDATTLYDPNALRYLAGAYLDASVGAASGRYDYYDPRAGSPSGLGSAAFWGLENWIKSMQFSISTLSGCSGCIYSVRRDLYTELSPDIISDLVQPLYVLLKGYRVAFEEKAQAWEEVTETARDEFRMRVRVATRGMKGLLSVSPLLMPWKYPWIVFQLWSHKIIRWCIPLFLLTFLAGSILLSSIPLFGFALIVQGLFYGFSLASILVPAIRRSRPLSLPLYFCTINAAFLLGLFHVALGRQYTVWQPQRR